MTNPTPLSETLFMSKFYYALLGLLISLLLLKFKMVATRMNELINEVRELREGLEAYKQLILLKDEAEQLKQTLEEIQELGKGDQEKQTKVELKIKSGFMGRQLPGRGRRCGTDPFGSTSFCVLTGVMAGFIAASVILR